MNKLIIINFFTYGFFFNITLNPTHVIAILITFSLILVQLFLFKLIKNLQNIIYISFIGGSIWTLVKNNASWTWDKIEITLVEQLLLFAINTHCIKLLVNNNTNILYLTNIKNFHLNPFTTEHKNININSFKKNINHKFCTYSLILIFFYCIYKNKLFNNINKKHKTVLNIFNIKLLFMLNLFILLCYVYKHFIIISLITFIFLTKTIKLIICYTFFLNRRAKYYNATKLISLYYIIK